MRLDEHAPSRRNFEKNALNLVSGLGHRFLSQPRPVHGAHDDGFRTVPPEGGLDVSRELAELVSPRNLRIGSVAECLATYQGTTWSGRLDRDDNRLLGFQTASDSPNGHHRTLH